MKKRLVSFVLALVVVLSLWPTAATAETTSKYKTILNDTLAQLTVTVSAPAFGTAGGEWSVLSLARSGYYEAGNKYFEGYYARVAETVKNKAVSVNKNGALDKNKSTENSRLIIALSAIDKDPTNVGGVDVLGAYDANGFNWIKKQGINGPIFALIALDTKNYPTSDTTLRQQCVDFILSKELSGGGWALSGMAADPDVTSMALQALVKYKANPAVASATDRAFTALSNIQKDDGGFASWGSVNSESIAQVITACSAWGIDAGTDSRFVKSGGSALDALLTFYIPAGKGFAHVLQSGGGYTGGEVNGMATDQAAYALVAYDRFKSGKTALYDMSDVQHTFGDWTVTESASCTKDGIRSHTCSVCGKVETEKIAVLEHKMTKTAAKAATCTREGNNEYYTCSACKKVFKDAAGKTETTVAAETLAVTDHNWQNATCTTPEICRECGRTRGTTVAHKYDANGICTVCGSKNPIAAVKVGEVKKADTVGGKTVSSENSGKIVADNSGLVVKTGETVTQEKLEEIKKALETGSTVIKGNAANTKEISAASTGAEELSALANSLTGEQKAEVAKLVEELTSMQTDTSKKNEKVEMVMDLSVSLQSASGIDVAALTELPAPITVTIPISNEMYQRLQGKTVVILRSHTDVRGNVVVAELAATLGGTEDNYFVQFTSDKFSTFALTSYEEVSSGHHGSSVTTPVAVKSAPTGDAGVIFYAVSALVSSACGAFWVSKRKES